MKQKVIDVKYRKDSISFPEWLKYEVTILNEDGTTEQIPAYGKDLQDALSRVAHDKKVEKVSKTTQRFPWWGWALIWFAYLGGLATLTRFTETEIVYGVGLALPAVIITLLNRWSIEQNRDRIERKKR